MAARTLSTTWKQLEKLVERLHEKQPVKTAVKDIDDLIQKANDSRIVDALASLLVTSYPNLEKHTLRFASSNGKKFPTWETDYDADECVILVNPVGVFDFYRKCHDATRQLKSPKARENFFMYRTQAFLAELSKLPSRLILFLLILNQVAACKEVSKAEKRGGGVETQENEDYLNLLWAFKELETFFVETTGDNIRSEFNLLWYESEWVSGK